MRVPAAARRATAEFLGTYLLVFAGPGAVVVDAVSGGGVGSLGIGLSFGLAVMAAIFALGHVSGAHINPAVTLAFTVLGRFPWSQAPFYFGGQIAGACGASLTHLALFGNVASLGASVPTGSALQALALEVAIAFFLMLVITAVATDARARGGAAAVAVGGYVALAATFSGPIAGASMNPARSFGPALVSGTWAHHWVYWLGPLVGTALGAVAYQFVRQADPPGAALDVAPPEAPP